MPHIKTLTVLGTGVLGSQIAYQAAFHGFAVTAYDVDDGALGKARTRFTRLAGIYQAEKVAGAPEGKAEAALRNLRLTADLGDAVADADLVIEAVPELLELKRDTYRKLAGLAPAKTIFATNSSTLLPSDLKDSTARPDRFLALHYANNIWAQNIVEVMGTAQTDPAAYAAVVEFARKRTTTPGASPPEPRADRFRSMTSSD
jgi:3-hydroxyacyl-CoA dehydrogenase